MKIVCATDFSEQARAAADMAAALARRLEDTLLLVHVVDPAPIGAGEMAAVPSGWQSAMCEVATAELTGEQERLRPTGVLVETRVLFGHPGSRVAGLSRDDLAPP